MKAEAGTADRGVPPFNGMDSLVLDRMRTDLRRSARDRLGAATECKRRAEMDAADLYELDAWTES